MARFWSSLLAISIAFGAVHGCPNGERRRRDVEVDSATFNDELAVFFGSCQPLKKAAQGVFESLQSSVDYVLRDSNWFQDFRKNTCTGKRDSSECWIFATDFLLDTNSIFYKPTAQCICEWAGDCFDPPSGRVQKRATRSSGLSEIPSTPAPPPECNPPFVSRPLTPEQKKFTACFEQKILKFKIRYPSIRRLEGSSISLLLRDHFTFCRTFPEDFPYRQRNFFQLLYIDQVCPRSGRSAAWRKDFIQVFREATRGNGPLGKTIDPCDPEKMPVYGPWGSWSKCSETCGEGTQRRRRKCIRSPCDQPTIDTRGCNYQPCPSGPCEPNPCLNGGICIPHRTSNSDIYNNPSIYSLRSDDPPTSDGFKCNCPKKYSGNRCHIGPPVCKDEYDFCNTYGKWGCSMIGEGCKKSCNMC